MPGMANDTRLEVRLPEDLLAQIDAARGDVPRAVFVRRALERALAGSEPAGRQTPVRTEPAPPRTSADMSPVLKTPREAPKAQRRQKASDAMSAALARQQALNKPKGI